MFPPVRRPPADTTGASRRELNFYHAPNCSKARAISVPPGRKAHIAQFVTLEDLRHAVSATSTCGWMLH